MGLPHLLILGGLSAPSVNDEPLLQVSGLRTAAQECCPGPGSWPLLGAGISGEAARSCWFCFAVVGFSSLWLINPVQTPRRFIRLPGYAFHPCKGFPRPVYVALGAASPPASRGESLSVPWPTRSAPVRPTDARRQVGAQAGAPGVRGAVACAAAAPRKRRGPSGPGAGPVVSVLVCLC